MQNLIGQKVHLIEEKLPLKGGKEYTQYKLDDPLFEKTVKDMYQNVRIFIPGTCGTLEWNPLRTNIHIDQNGIVTNVTHG